MAWLGQQLKVGEDVREPEGRHRGKWVGMEGARYKVVWYDTGWITFFKNLSDMERWT